MQRGPFFCGSVLAVVIAGWLAEPAQAVITRLTPLADVLDKTGLIVTAKVESVDARKPALVLTVDETLKGKAPFSRLAVSLKGDAEAVRHNHTEQLLERVAPRLPLVLFVVERGKSYTVFAYSNGTWFQMAGTQTNDGLRWRFLHCEPNLRKTFKGSTAQLRQVVIDGLAGKKKPPEPDAQARPGLGPKVERDSTPPPRSGARRHGGPPIAVIPTVLVGGPLAILAMLFPAVFGGLMLVLRRWMAGLCIISINSTLYLLHGRLAPHFLQSWWATPLALWLTMSALTSLGLLWAWRRHAAWLCGPTANLPAVPSTPQAPSYAQPPGRVELGSLALVSLGCLGLVLYLPHEVAKLDLWGKTVWMISGGIWAALVHALARRGWPGRRAARPALPGEGVMLWTMLLVGLAFSATFVSESTADESDAPFRIVWRFRLPMEGSWIPSSPAVDDDRVYVAIAQQSGLSQGGAVYAVNRRSGKVAWAFNDDGGMKQVFSSPIVVDGRLYIGEGFHEDTDCKVYCLNAATGEKVWEHHTASHTEATPLVVAGKVYCGAGDDGLYCLDAQTGKPLWHYEKLHIDAQPVVADGRLYAGSVIGDKYTDRAVICLDAASGKEHWRVPVDLPVGGSVVLREQLLYVSLGNGKFGLSDEDLAVSEKPAGDLLCLEADSGRLRWHHRLSSGVLVRPAVDEDHVYFGGKDRHCYKLDRKKGELLWKVDLGSPILAAPVLVQEGERSFVFVADSGGRVVRLDAASGAAHWWMDVPQDTGKEATLYCSPVVRIDPERHRRRLYFGCGLNLVKGNPPQEGVLYCLEEREEVP